MSLDKAIEHGKEKRRPYRGSKRFDRSCRHGGNCGWCEGNRTVKNKRQIPADTEEQLRNGADEPQELRGWQRRLNRADVCACHGMTNCQLMD
jgi:hypothetical protein